MEVVTLARALGLICGRNVQDALLRLADQSLPEELLHPLPPWDAVVSGGLFFALIANSNLRQISRRPLFLLQALGAPRLNQSVLGNMTY